MKKIVLLNRLFLMLLWGIMSFLPLWMVLSFCSGVNPKFELLAAKGSGVIWVPDNYTTIQAAINAADAGCTIMVRNETYYENVIVNETVKLVGIDFPTIDGSLIPSMWGYPTVKVYASNVTISGFTIQHRPPHTTKELDSGILIAGENTNLSGNIIRFNSEGVDILGSNNNTVSENLITSNWNGITCDGLDHHIIGNNISSNGDGISVGGSKCSLIDNVIMENRAYGVLLMNNETIMKRNDIKSNGYNFGTPEHLLSHLINDIDASNTVDSKPIYYWINYHNETVPANAGYVALINCTNITADSLNLKNNVQGICIAYTENCTVKNCNISKNQIGIHIWASSNVNIYHNNFINNSYRNDPLGYPMSHSTWDNGYPSGGNYWSDYKSSDFFNGFCQNETGSDGIGDTAQTIDVNNVDNYPLMAPIKAFDVGVWNNTQCQVHIISNSTISNFLLNATEKKISFNATGATELGFCRVTIPNTIIQDMWQNNYTVLVDDKPPLEIRNWTDPTNTYLYFIYQHSEHKITIIPENPTTTTLLLALAATTITITTIKKKLLRKRPHT